MIPAQIIENCLVVAIFTWWVVTFALCWAELIYQIVAVIYSKMHGSIDRYEWSPAGIFCVSFNQICCSIVMSLWVLWRLLIF